MCLWNRERSKHSEWKVIKKYEHQRGSRWNAFFRSDFYMVYCDHSLFNSINIRLEQFDHISDLNESEAWSCPPKKKPIRKPMRMDFGKIISDKSE